MARGHAGRIGPPHVTRAKESFSALDMFAQLTTFTTPAAGGNDIMIFEAGEIMIFENGETMVFE